MAMLAGISRLLAGRCASAHPSALPNDKVIILVVVRDKLDGRRIVEISMTETFSRSSTPPARKPSLFQAWSVGASSKTSW
jgi:hypothetical protein